MKNHLFIGLGGQGGKTIAELKKVFASRDRDASQLKELGLACDFLYIDSSRDVTDERRNWFHYGKDLSLKPDSFLYLKEGGESIDVASMAERPDVAPWIGDKDKLQGFLEGVQGIQGANQRRRLGRLLFARNAERIRKAVCEDKIGPMRANSNQCAVHVFASLAGGTGSGCLVDLVTLIRSEFPNAAATDGFPIFLYVYVTNEKFQAAQVGFFHENQAATLRDLNALACGKYKPTLFGTARGSSVFSGDEPIAQILLSTHLSSKNQRLSLTQQHQIVAEAAFERIFSYASGNLDTTFQKSLTGEDLMAAFSGEPIGNLLRSFRFGSVGMRRWEVPIDEIRELLAKDLFACCCRKLLFQNWSDSRGPVGEKIPNNIPGFSEALGQITALVDSELLLKNQASEIIRSLEAEFNRYHAGKTKEGFKETDLAGYEAELQQRYDQELNGGGITAIFRELEAGKSQRLERIEAGVQSIIKASWLSSGGRLGLAYMDELLLKAQEAIRNRITENAAVPNGQDTVRLRMEKRKFEWGKITFLSRPFRQTKLALAHQNDLANLCRADIRRRAEVEDRKLQDIVGQRLGMLASEFQRAEGKVAEWAEAARKRRDGLLQDLRALKEKGPQDDQDVVANKPEFSLDDLEAHLKDQSLEATHIENSCDELIHRSFAEALGSAPLTNLGRLSDEQETLFIESSDSVVYRKVEEIHKSIQQRTHRDSVLSGNVLDVLQLRHREDPARFINELRQFIDSATCNIERANGELQPRDLKGDPGMPSMPRAGLLIGVPSGHPFGTELKGMIRPLLAAGSSESQGVYFHDDPTQIRLLFVNYWMAARFAKVVHHLEQMYRESLQHDHAGDFKYFTNLDPSGERGARPSLLRPSPQESLSSMRAALWLGSRISGPNGAGALVQDTENGAILIEYQDDGIVPRRIGDSILALSSASDAVTTARVTDAVASQVSMLPDDRIEELKATLKKDDSEKLTTQGPGSSRFIEWTKDRERIHELLKR
ncbi:MAG: hypothetical protein B9S38_13240 [Verrucomicrobiia bacterium Tous-C4TDCM]|nr:MAG: hypothetical protein B9S38_13240 [Verrucomicrobiae bacterium Tous-C4TDCM]